MKIYIWLLPFLTLLMGHAYAQNNFQQQLQNIESSLNEDVAVDEQQASSELTNVRPQSQQTQATASAPAATPAASPASSTNQQANKQATLRDEAFASMTSNLLPLSPAQIEMLRGLYDATQRAAAVFPGTPPKPTSTSVAVDLSPGQTPPIIRLGAGFVTSLVFVDSTGAPWPIDSYSLGNPSAFNIQWDKKSNILLIQAITSHRVANLAVLLKGLNTPVMINLTPGQAAMDTRVDMRIPGLGPSAKPPAFTASLPGVENPALIALLDGVAPESATELQTNVCDNCAWLMNEKLYLRMPYTLLSPGWISTLSSADGTNVYELQPTPLVLASYNGKTIQLKIEGF
jgi:intracellular multiplication protein IcmK